MKKKNKNIMKTMVTKKMNVTIYLYLIIDFF